MNPSSRHRLVVIGLDGATFDLIEPWAEAGQLPNLRRLMAQGSWGRLRSVVHPFTAQAWTSMVTGTQQGKHRVFDFWERDFDTYGFRLLNASHRALPALWSLLSKAGKDVIMVNLPQTYPPETVSGVMISGRDTPGLGSGYTYPASVKSELDQVTSTPYMIVPDDWLWMQRGRPDLARTELLREVDVRFQAVKHLMQTRPWDLTFFVDSATDGVAHFFWKYHDSTHALHNPDEASLYGDAILEVYRRCDEHIGDLLQWLASQEEPCNVLVVSDHGQGPLGPQAIHLNLWLESQGLLQFRGSGNKRNVGEMTTNLASRAIQKGKRSLYGRIRFQTLTKLRRLWPDRLRTWLGADAFFPEVDWRRTRAFSEELRGNIWINLRGRDPMGIVEPGVEYETLRDNIINTLPLLTDPLTGTRPIHRVWRREELYQGPFLERFPDLIVEADYPDMFKPHGSYRGPAPVRHLAPQEMAQRAITGCHRMDGIFIAWGPDIQPGARTEIASLIDVAPTILHLLGHPVPMEMDGRVLSEILQPEALPPVEISSLVQLGFDNAGISLDYTDEEAEHLRQRLSGLGYLG